MNDFVRTMKALGDETRARIMRLVLEKELCVCQIIEVIRLAPSTISKHLLILKNAGLIEGRKCGRWIHYRAAKTGRNSPAQATLALLRAGLEYDSKSQADRKRLAAVLRLDREILCQRSSDRKRRKGK
jgi:DNA-binding transcriptional ArsR family regulator